MQLRNWSIFAWSDLWLLPRLIPHQIHTLTALLHLPLSCPPWILLKIKPRLSQILCGHQWACKIWHAPIWGSLSWGENLEMTEFEVTFWMLILWAAVASSIYFYCLKDQYWVNAFRLSDTSSREKGFQACYPFKIDPQLKSLLSDIDNNLFPSNQFIILRGLLLALSHSFPRAV